MTNEIIIDGVNVAECEYLDTGMCNAERYCDGYTNVECETHHDCYYKQLQRLKQENEILKEKLDEYEKAGGIIDEGQAWYGRCQTYEQALADIKEIAERTYLHFECDDRVIEKCSDCSMQDNCLKLNKDQILAKIAEVENV